MGSSKKKEKKKKKKRSRNSDNDSPSHQAANFSTDGYPTLEDYYLSKEQSKEKSSSYSVEDEGRSRRKDTNNKHKERKERKSTNVPQTEEFVYDQYGQEIVQGSRDMSISPDRNENFDKYDKYESRRDRSRSPVSRSRKALTPPPLPPGVDWPFDSSQPRPPGDDEYENWKDKDDRNRDRDYQQEVDRKYRAKQKEGSKKTEVEEAPAGDGSSLSIEETNKLREKLGLKPLQVDDGSSSAPVEKGYDEREDVHRPASNISQKKEEDKMRERMEAIREKRRINQKLRKTKGLGEEDDPVIDSAAAWVAKSRQQEKEKAMAQKRAQMLEEMDEEFGISGLVEETVGKIKKEPTYGSKDLRGLKVQHKGNSFQEKDALSKEVDHKIQEGSQVILTLEDKAILGEDNEDVLINVNIADDERTKQNVANRQKKPGYKAYDEVDEETGMLKVRSVLDKYDEEIQGSQKASFTIDGSGKADDAESELDRIRQTLKSQQKSSNPWLSDDKPLSRQSLVSLSMDAPQLARDYYTQEEMVTFKKPRKKIRKVRKRTVLKADDLLKLNHDDTQQDRGSRSQKSIRKKPTRETVDGEEDMKIVPAGPDELDYFIAVSQHEEPAAFVDDDEAEHELQLALERSRRTKQKKGNESDEEDAILQKIALEVLNKPKAPEPEFDTQPINIKSKKKGKTTIVLDSTSEFCRTLGELPTATSTSKAKKEPEAEDMEIEVEQPTSKLPGGWEQIDTEKTEEVDMKVEEKGTSQDADVKNQEDEDVLEAEPLPTGIAATLNLANMKGYLKEGKQKIRKFDPLNLPETKAEVDVEKLRDEEKGRYGRGYDRDRDRYDPYAFKDKSNYKPAFKLEYVDNKGRELNQKEAFRLLSHKFHGKGSGKLKTEKRAKKLQDQKKLLNMSSIDTPLNTSSMFKEKQKSSQTPYLVLSGGGKNLLSGESLKK